MTRYWTFLHGLIGRTGARIESGQHGWSLSSAPQSRLHHQTGISLEVLETNGRIVDGGPCPEANAEDEPKRDVEKYQAATQPSVVSDAPDDNRHYRSA